MHRHVRVLLAWFERREAISALLGFRLPDEGDDKDAVGARYDAARAAMLARPPYNEDAPLLEPLPAEIEQHAQAILEPMRASVRREQPPRELDAGIIDLSRLISFQKAVALDQIQGRVAAASQDDWQALADLTDPLGR